MNNFSCRSFFPCIAQYTHSQVIKQINYQILVVQQPLEVKGIGSKMLSKELQELEVNGLVKRTVLNTKPVMIEYEITEYGQTLNPIINEMSTWGIQHRQRILST